MQAIEIERWGGPEVMRLVERERPVPKRGDVLVRVLAAGVNPVDWKMRQGALRALPGVKLPLVLGFDLCGEVIATGEGVTRFEGGERVWARVGLRAGAYAEYAVVDEAHLGHAPPGLSPEEAAAIPLAGLTALQALRDQGQLRAGSRLLVVGGAGGVGHLAVQIGKALGAHVTATCSERNLEFVRSIGADEALDYGARNPYVASTPYDVIYDTISREPYRKVARSLAPAGIFLGTLPRFDTGWRLALMPLYSRRRVRVGSVKSSSHDLDQLRALVESHKLQVHIQKVFPLEEAANAHRASEGGHVRGKLALHVAEASTP